ncbi:hypothetical protein LJC07_03975 [Christensenellaceae bacterium OttesenSCG-928-L17]|nr:hypothetical protein [Christensenellaceae bacterium OttesenSCG-928-L17]
MISLKAHSPTLRQDIASGDVTLSLTVDKEYSAAVKRALPEMLNKTLRVDAKQWREKRSLDANAYAWVLFGKIAEVLNTSKDDVYLIMLERYGVYTHVIVQPKAVERVKEEWRTVIELGEVTVNGKSGVQLQCFYGSSTFDTKEMSRLIDGTVNEAKQLGIETLPPTELAAMIGEWNVAPK